MEALMIGIESFVVVDGPYSEEDGAALGYQHTVVFVIFNEVSERIPRKVSGGRTLGAQMGHGRRSTFSGQYQAPNGIHPRWKQEVNLRGPPS